MKLDRQGREPSKPAPRWVRIVLWLAVLALFIPAFFLGCCGVGLS